MASSSSSSAGKGAAEEPEPEPGESYLPTAAPAPYDPRVYQPLHPDDRDGGDGKLTKKGAKGKTKGGVKGKAEFQ